MRNVLTTVRRTCMLILELNGLTASNNLSWLAGADESHYPLQLDSDYPADSMESLKIVWMMEIPDDETFFTDG